MDTLLDEFIEQEKNKGYTVRVLKRKRDFINEFIESVQKPVTSVTYEDILSYFDLQEVASFNRKVSYIRQFFEFLLEKGKVLVNPSINIEKKDEPEGEHLGLFNEEEIKRIIYFTKLTPVGLRDRAIIELFYSTGIRISELVNIDIDDIDFNNNELYIYMGKMNKDRIVPVGNAALDAVKRYLKFRHFLLNYQKEYDALFLSTRGIRISISAARCLIHRRKKDASVDSKGAAHALRHSCATHMLKNGAPVTAIQRLLGHEHLHATERYTHVNEKEMQSKFRESMEEDDEPADI